MLMSFMPSVVADETAEETKQEYQTFTDDLDDFSKVKSRSKELEIVELSEAMAAYDGNAGAISCASAFEGSEIVYEVPFEIGSYTVYLYGAATNGTKLSVYHSVDGKDWEKDKWAEHRSEGKGRVYHDPEVLCDKHFLKIVFNNEINDPSQYIYKVVIREEPFVELSGTRIKNTDKPDFDYYSIPSLKEAYKDYFKIGVAAESFDIETYPDLLKTQFNHFLSENQSRFAGLQKSEGNFTFQWADKIFDFGIANDMEVRLHALFYYINTPAWVFKAPGGGEMTEEILRSRYEKHIKTVVGNYKGKIKYFDMVNELIDGGVYRSYMSEFKTFGLDKDKFEDFLADCFLWGYEANPDAKFLFLDNGLAGKEKRDIIWTEILPRVLEKTDARGVPRENIMIGEQGHWGMNTPITIEDDPTESIEAMLIEAKKTGLHLGITELDLGLSAAAVASDLKGETVSMTRADRMELQAKKYASIFDILREYSDIIEFVSFWNVTDNTNWRAQTTQSFALLFDYNNEPYPAFYRVFDFEKKEPRWTMDDVTEVTYANGWTERKIHAAYGTPKIDGKIDEVWNKTEVCDIDRQTVGEDGIGATGTVRCLWDENNFYVLVDVKDDILNAEHEYSYNQDCVELYISEQNHSNYFESGDNQIRQTISGIKDGKYGAEGGVEFDAALTKNADGYTMEFIYPMRTTKNEEGMVLGFDTQVTDHVDGSGTRRSIRMFCDNLKDTYITLECWGEAELVYDYVPEGEEADDSVNGEAAGGSERLLLEIGEQKTTLNAVKSENGTVMVPLKNLVEFLGGTVRYNASDASISVSAVGNKATFREGGGVIYTLSGAKNTDTPISKIGGKLYVPLQNMIDALNIENAKY